MRVAFFHPDLGFGGAERLVVDAALGLQQRGHDVVVFTSHCDRARAFEEVQRGEVRVVVAGDLPQTRALLLVVAILRSLVLTAYYLYAVHVSQTEPRADVIFVDQLPACIPLLRLFTTSKILFYGHFPDKLLSPRGGLLKRLYRVPLDALELHTTGMAHRLVVNSQFTADVFLRAFPRLALRPHVLHPAINFAQYDDNDDDQDSSMPPSERLRGLRGNFILSVNRFEAKKDVALAVRLLAALRSSASGGQLQLVLAGGYDERVADNAQTLRALEALAGELGLVCGRDVIFCANFSRAERGYLLRRARLLVYTPAHEHFGIVPVEAMYSRLPVLARNSGGPTETVLHGRTGFLCETLADFVQHAETLLVHMSAPAREAMGDAARAHAVANFALSRFAERLETLCAEMTSRDGTK